MQLERCEYCGVEIEEMGIDFKGRFFCSDECCDIWEDTLLANGEPAPGELKDSELTDIENIEISETGDLETELDDYDEYSVNEF